MKRRLFAAIAGLVVLSTAGQAHAQYPPCTVPVLTVDPTTGAPGFSFVATVTNCRANETVVFGLPGQSVSATCNPVTLQASATMTAPEAPGPVAVTATLQGVTSPDQAAQVTAQPTGFRRSPAQAPGQATTCPPINESITLDAQATVLPSGVPTTTTPTTTNPSTPTTTVEGSIPSTGSTGLGATSTIGVVLLAVGVGLFTVARLRRRPSRAS